jgi:hypothetical protein
MLEGHPALARGKTVIFTRNVQASFRGLEVADILWLKNFQHMGFRELSRPNESPA